jgi:hypothetical protein
VKTGLIHQVVSIENPQLPIIPENKNNSLPAIPVNQTQHIAQPLTRTKKRSISSRKKWQDLRSLGGLLLLPKQ